MEAPLPAPSEDPHAGGAAAALRIDSPFARLLADAVPVMLAYYASQELRCVFANARYAQLNGFTPETILGRTARQVLGEDTWAFVEPHIRQVLQGQAVRYEREQALPGGGVRFLEVSMVPHLVPPSPGGAPLAGVFVLVSDITHHRLAERALAESEERMRKFTSASEEGIIFHTDGVILDCNEAALHLTGFAREEVLGRPLREFILPQYQQAVRAYTAEQREDVYEVGVRRKDGGAIHLEVIGKSLPGAASGQRVVVLRDVSARKQAQARAEFLALHDALTHLPNRNHLMQHLARTLAEAQARDGRVAVLFIDLDHFRTVNDSLGHEAGDRLLREMARRLQEGVQVGQFAARVGADQFVLVLEAPKNAQDAATSAARVLAQLHLPHAVDGVPVSLSACVGVSLFPEDGHTADKLLRRATTAVRHAKEAGRGSYSLYLPTMEGHAPAVLQQEHLLRRAVREQQFVLHYQPQVRVDTGRLHGFEALVRWQHPEEGLLGPDHFIPLAESRGLITAIGRWVLREACRQVRAWHEAGFAGLQVSVNLSAIEFRQRDMVAYIEETLRECGLAPRFLDVEITETALMQHAGPTRETLAALRALGVSVTVDDFGTGYSSLAYLKRYPLDKIKVDRSFVIDTPQDADDVAIVTAVVQLARSLQLQSVAEGVENPEQLALLRGLGCDLAQGYGIARPLPAAEARAWMQAAQQT